MGGCPHFSVMAVFAMPVPYIRMATNLTGHIYTDFGHLQKGHH